MRYALPHRSHRGASLLEVMVVVVIMSILAITAVPAVTTAMDSSHAAAARELRRQIEMARANAAASGRPTGLVVDFTASTTLLRTLQNEQVTSVTDAMGQAHQAVDYPALFHRASISSVSGGLTTQSGESLWFAFDGTPHRRNAQGVRTGGIDSPVVYTLSTGQTVTVHPVGGHIE
jgi:prepilin-type N-terminal cleavage/methylation domain-containing protein